MKKLLQTVAAECDEIEIFSLSSQSTGVGFSNNILKSTFISQNSGIGIRLIKAGKLAQSSSSNPATYEKLVHKTLELAEFGETIEFHFSEPAPIQALQLYNPSAEKYSIEEMVAIGHEMLNQMKKYDPEVLTFCGSDVTIEEVGIVNSNGFNDSFKRSQFSFGVGGQLVEGKNIIYGYRHYTGLNPLTDHQKLLEESIEDLDVGRRPAVFNGKKALILFTPRALADILIPFQQGVDGSNVAKGTSPLTGKLGAHLFDTRLTIYDDPLHPEGKESNPFDDEGTTCRSTALVDRGILKNYILDRKSAGKLNLTSTANGYRKKALLLTHGYAQGVAPHASNLIMAPGTKAYDKLIGSMADGIVVDQITGILLGNLLNGDFSGSIGLGYRVVGGKRVGRVKDVMISGNFYHLFAEQLVDLSAERLWTGALGGDVGSCLLPWGLFSEVDVATGR